MNVTPMSAAVFAERLAAELDAINKAAAGLLPLVEALPPQHPDRVPLREAEATLRECADSISHLATHLFPYSQPCFYKELPPSLAAEDQGRSAAGALEYVFSE